VVIKKHEISRVLKPTDEINSVEEVRVEVIRDDQIGREERDLLRAAQAEVGETGWLSGVKMPFLILRRPEATIEEVKEMIKTGLHLSDEVAGHLRIVVKDRNYSLEFERYDPVNGLKKGQTVAVVFRSRNDMLTICRQRELCCSGGIAMKN
jgi:hypothetical protein